jgi:thiol-disulfide isomerase/thioredoxin
MPTASRRAVLAGLAAAAPAIAAAATTTTTETHFIAGPGDFPKAVVWSDKPAFPEGPLATNPVARQFVAPAAGTTWPEEVPLQGEKGAESIRRWRGKTLLVTLWAEWCAPCLAEMPALSRLNRTYGGGAFAILPIATMSHTLQTVTDAQARLARVPGADIATLLDGSHSHMGLAHALAQTALSPEAQAQLPKAATGATAITSSSTLPCLVVVDPQGRLRGRAMGVKIENGLVAWETPKGQDFLKALAAGAVRA